MVNLSKFDQIRSKCIWLEPASAKLTPAWLKTGLGRDLERAKVHLARPLSSGVKFDDFVEFDHVWSRCIWLEPASAKLTQDTTKTGWTHELDTIKL